MVRQKKADDKSKDGGATLSIDVDSFVRTRDSVVTGLATLQDAIQTLSTAYIKHTNAVLGEHGAEFNMELAKLGQNPLLNLGSGLDRAASPPKSAAAGAASASAAEGSDKKERKKRQHDPNAPKRPLTPFFLYMQTARPIIANDLGPEAAKGAVSNEGQRRWTTMEADDKQLWTNAYKDNLRLYNARMHSYKGGNLTAKDMNDDDALAYADEHHISLDTPATAEGQLATEAAATAFADEDAEGEPEKEPTPQPKTPKAKAARKGKAAKTATPAEAAEPIVPTPSASIVPPKSGEKEKSPDKKRKRASKKGAEEPVASTEKEELAVETPKSAPKKRAKKAKADA